MPISKGTSIEWNKRALTLLIGAACFLLYLFYNYLPSIGTKYHIHEQSSWKLKKYKSVPQEIVHLQKKIAVIQKHINIFDGDYKLQVFYHEALPVNSIQLPVLLLHGAGDSSKRWQELGTMNLVAAMGHRVVAIDLPGWGSTKSKSKDIMKEVFMKTLLEKLNLVRPVIIAPSMAGTYAIPYLMTPSAASCHERARGFVPIAATSTDKYTPAQYHRCIVPSMLVFGENDTHLGLSMVGDLRNLANSEIEPVAKAGHAVMFEKPREWHVLLYSFLKNLISNENNI